MKTLLVIVVICTTHFLTYAQNYEAEVTPKGIIFPTMGSVERNNIANPVDGQCIFNLGINGLDCYDGDQWFSVQSMGEHDRSNRNTSYGFLKKTNQPGEANTVIGYFAEVQGDHNSVLGYKAGNDALNGDYNTFLGSIAGGQSNGSHSVYLGYGAGFQGGGERNVFIGSRAGLSLLADNTLIIESGELIDQEYPLLHGSFEENYLNINGKVNISELMKLAPLENQPTCTTEDLGTIYMDKPSDRLMLCTSIGWQGLSMQL